MKLNVMFAVSTALLLAGATVRSEEKKLTFNSTAMARAAQKDESALLKKLKATRIPKFKIKDMQVEDAFGFLSKQYKTMSVSRSGMNVLFKNTPAEAKKKLISVDLSSTDVPATDILYYLCMNAGLNFRVDEYAVVVWVRKKNEKLTRY